MILGCLLKRDAVWCVKLAHPPAPKTKTKMESTTTTTTAAADYHEARVAWAGLQSSSTTSTTSVRHGLPSVQGNGFVCLRKRWSAFISFVAPHWHIAFKLDEGRSANKDHTQQTHKQPHTHVCIMIGARGKPRAPQGTGTYSNTAFAKTRGTEAGAYTA